MKLLVVCSEQFVGLGDVLFFVLFSGLNPRRRIVGPEFALEVLRCDSLQRIRTFNKAEERKTMIQMVDGVAEYRWARRVGPPVDLNELASMCRYRAGNVADTLGISCRQLERDFRKYMGVTPKYWLREQRAQRAIDLISSGTELEHVSKELGFKRYGHFSREIRAFFGVKPVELVN